MGRQGGKAKSKKSAGHVPKSDAISADKEKMKELAEKKRELEEELDELKGNTAKGKAVCTLVFLISIGLLLGLFAGMIKLDVGGFAGTFLAPLIGDVPIARDILPAEMQRKSRAELAAAEAEAAAEAKAGAEAEAAAALQDYVNTYSAMNPQDAAKLFDSMIPDQEEVVIGILENLTPKRRAAILSSMSVTNAADLTKKMQQKIEEKTLH